MTWYEAETQSILRHSTTWTKSQPTAWRGMELTRAEKAFDANPIDEAAQKLAAAQDHFTLTVGEGISNNSKLGEALGEEAARHHMLQLEEFAGAREITDLPETANGSRRSQLTLARQGG